MSWAVVCIPPWWRAGGSGETFIRSLYLPFTEFSSRPPWPLLLPRSVLYQPSSIFLAWVFFSVYVLLLSSMMSVPLTRLAAHLPEIRTAAELEFEHQRAVGHFVYVFAFWREKENSCEQRFLIWFKQKRVIPVISGADLQRASQTQT